MSVKEEFFTLARAIKRALIVMLNGSTRFKLLACGNTYYVSYGTRHHRIDRDYELLQRLAQNRKCIVDIEANKGLTCLIMANAMSVDGKIYAFEASEDACRVVKENLAYNDLSQRVVLLNALVTNRSGEVCDFYWAFDSGAASMIEGFLGNNYAIKKPGISLDSFCQENNVNPDFIKIDVEGAEAEVMAGMEKIMRTGRPLVEVHSWGDLTEEHNIAKILAVVDRAGYQLFNLRTRTRVSDPAVFTGWGASMYFWYLRNKAFLNNLSI